MKEKLKSKVSFCRGKTYEASQFKPLKSLGGGAFGTVGLFRYKDKIDVVLKAIKKSEMLRTFGLESEEKFLNEVNIMKKLGDECENSVKLYDYFEDDEQYVIMLEVCDTNLEDYVKNEFDNEVIDEKEAKNIMMQLNKVFKLMQKEGIAHRDIKPENILVKKISGKILFKLSDYGLGKKVPSKVTKTFVGTQGFRAPEIELRKINYDATLADIFEFGVTIYKLLFNKNPYVKSNIVEFYRNNIDNETMEESLIINTKDTNLNDLLKKMLIINPNKRIKWNDYFNHPFFQKTATFKKSSSFDIDSMIKSCSTSKRMEFNQFIAKKRLPEEEEKKSTSIKKASGIIRIPKRKLELLFMVDATGSMQPIIDKVKDYCKSTSQMFKDNLKNFEILFGAVFYRDPVDSFSDIHEKIDFTEDINYFKSSVDNIKEDGGADQCEDWLGAYKMAIENMNWGEKEEGTLKVIIHITDSPAHGKEFTSFDTHFEEGEKLLDYMKIVSLKNISIVGLYIQYESCEKIGELTKNCFDECKKIFAKFGNKKFVIEQFDQNNNDPKYFPTLIYNTTKKSTYSFR